MVSCSYNRVWKFLSQVIELDQNFKTAAYLFDCKKTVKLHVTFCASYVFLLVKNIYAYLTITVHFFVDNAPNNTSPLIGAMYFVEQELKRPVQHIIGMFHMVELPIK